MKIVTIVGARPQFVKAVVVSKELRKHHHEVLVHTGQHYDVELSRVFFDELGIPEPDYNLGIGSDTHARQTGRAMMSIEDTLLAEKPELVLVYGDTNSTLAAALAAVKLHIPVAHVEAGPRMFDRNIPEEVNRVLTDHVSSLLFAPTQTSVENLKKEGITAGVHLTGDVMLDSFLYFSRVARDRSQVLQRLGLEKGRYLLATVHRARNTDIEQNLRSMIEAFLSLDEKIVFPVHPRTQKKLDELNLNLNLIPQAGSRAQSESESHLHLLPPVGYLDSLILTQNASKVLTDSGGLQKEAYFAGVPCITLDDSTGWPETVEDGWNILVGSRREEIIESVRRFRPEGTQREIFGDGRAAQRIVQAMPND